MTLRGKGTNNSENGKEKWWKICKLWKQWALDESNVFYQFDRKIVYKK